MNDFEDDWLEESEPDFYALYKNPHHNDLSPVETVLKKIIKNEDKKNQKKVLERCIDFLDKIGIEYSVKTPSTINIPIITITRSAMSSFDRYSNSYSEAGTYKLYFIGKNVIYLSVLGGTSTRISGYEYDGSFDIFGNGDLNKDRDKFDGTNVRMFEKSLKKYLGVSNTKYKDFKEVPHQEYITALSRITKKGKKPFSEYVKSDDVFNKHDLQHKLFDKFKKLIDDNYPNINRMIPFTNSLFEKEDNRPFMLKPFVANEIYTATDIDTIPYLVAYKENIFHEINKKLLSKFSVENLFTNLYFIHNSDSDILTLNISKFFENDISIKLDNKSAFEKMKGLSQSDRDKIQMILDKTNFKNKRSSNKDINWIIKNIKNIFEKNGVITSIEEKEDYSLEIKIISIEKD